jgi:hypothetical protein
MVCPCCRETVACQDGARPVPASITVVISVGTLLEDRSGVAGCAAWFPTAVNGTYVLSRIPGTLSYTVLAGSIRVSFDFLSNSSLLQIDFCASGTPCSAFVSVSWLLERGAPGLCGWPNAGGGTVQFDFSSSEPIVAASYFSCRIRFLQQLLFYAGSISVTPA